jgi:hypothetical protein
MGAAGRGVNSDNSRAPLKSAGFMRMRKRYLSSLYKMYFVRFEGAVYEFFPGTTDGYARGSLFVPKHTPGPLHEPATGYITLREGHHYYITAPRSEITENYEMAASKIISVFRPDEPRRFWINYNGTPTPFSPGIMIITGEHGYFQTFEFYPDLCLREWVYGMIELEGNNGRACVPREFVFETESTCRRGL